MSSWVRARPSTRSAASVNFSVLSNADETEITSCVPNTSKAFVSPFTSATTESVVMGKAQPLPQETALRGGCVEDANPQKTQNGKREEGRKPRAAREKSRIERKKPQQLSLSPQSQGSEKKNEKRTPRPTHLWMQVSIRRDARLGLSVPKLFELSRIFESRLHCYIIVIDEFHPLVRDHSTSLRVPLSAAERARAKISCQAAGQSRTLTSRRRCATHSLQVSLPMLAIKHGVRFAHVRRPFLVLRIAYRLVFEYC